MLVAIFANDTSDSDWLILLMLLTLLIILTLLILLIQLTIDNIDTIEVMYVSITDDSKDFINNIDFVYHHETFVAFYSHLLSPDVMWCHLMSYDVTWCHVMSIAFIYFHLMTSSITSLTPLNDFVESWWILLVSNFLSPYLLTYSH